MTSATRERPIFSFRHPAALGIIFGSGVKPIASVISFTGKLMGFAFAQPIFAL